MTNSAAGAIFSFRNPHSALRNSQMTFLQPYLLWLLPLAALPDIIHLLNRMRFRTVHWAATSFLFSANRASTRYARVRQWLLLACRVLALLAMLLAVARPLAGGWAGWMLSTSPDAVVLIPHGSLGQHGGSRCRKPGASRGASRRSTGTSPPPPRPMATWAAARGAWFSRTCSGRRRKLPSRRCCPVCPALAPRIRRPIYPRSSTQRQTGFRATAPASRKSGSRPIFSGATGSRRARAGRRHFRAHLPALPENRARAAAGALGPARRPLPRSRW